MAHESWSAFFAMGGYAMYVWPAYGLAAAVLLANVIAPMSRHRQLLRKLKRQAQRTDRQGARGSSAHA